MELPNLDHITEEDYEVVYKPADDTLLIIDALKLEMKALSKLDPTICLEVGSGCGINITAFAKAFPSCFCLSGDINMKACEITVATGEANNALVECINMDLATCVKSQVADVVIFHAPYVVTENVNPDTSDVSRVWAGGKNGREVMDRFLYMLPEILADHGVCYMMVMEQNIPEEIKRNMTDLGFTTTTVGKPRKVREVKVQVYKFSK